VKYFIYGILIGLPATAAGMILGLLPGIEKDGEDL
jgi:hypothetical protein